MRCPFHYLLLQLCQVYSYLCLMIMASPASTSYFCASPSRNFLARYTPPASGDTITAPTTSAYHKDQTQRHDQRIPPLTQHTDQIRPDQTPGFDSPPPSLHPLLLPTWVVQVLVAEVRHAHGAAVQVVHGHPRPEEALDLAAVQVHRHHAVHAHRLPSQDTEKGGGSSQRGGDRRWGCVCFYPQLCLSYARPTVQTETPPRTRSFVC